jgi:hypothetical protein
MGKRILTLPELACFVLDPDVQQTIIEKLGHNGLVAVLKAVRRRLDEYRPPEFNG